MEGNEVQGYAEHRSYVEIKENAKLDVQFGVKVYADDDEEEMKRIAGVAMDTYIHLRDLFSKATLPER